MTMALRPGSRARSERPLKQRTASTTPAQACFGQDAETGGAALRQAPPRYHVRYRAPPTTARSAGRAIRCTCIALPPTCSSRASASGTCPLRTVDDGPRREWAPTVTRIGSRGRRTGARLELALPSPQGLNRTKKNLSSSRLRWVARASEHHYNPPVRAPFVYRLDATLSRWREGFDSPRAYHFFVAPTRAIPELVIGRHDATSGHCPVNAKASVDDGHLSRSIRPR